MQADSEAAKLAADLAELEGLAHASHSRVMQLEAQVEAHCDAAIADVQRHEAAMDALQQVFSVLHTLPGLNHVHCSIADLRQ